MKKKFALFLCVVMCMMAFAGCSNAEVGYLQFAKEMTALTTADMSGTVDVYYDADAMKTFFIGEAVKNGLGTKEELESEFAAFTGTKKLSFSYDGSMDYTGDDMKFYYDMTVGVDGTKMPLGKLFFSMKDGIYVEKEVMANLYELSEKLMPQYKDSYFYSSEYKKEFNNALGSQKYIKLLSMKDMMQGVPADQVNAMMGKEQNMAILDAAYKFIGDVFQGYSTDIVKEIPNGYQLSLNGDQMIQLLEGCLDYAANNLDSVMSATTEYLKAVSKIMGLEEEMPDMTLDAQQKMKVSGAISGIKTGLTDLYKSGNLDAVKPFAYKETVKKMGDTYTGNSELTMTVAGKQIGYIKSQSKVTKNTAAATYPTAGTDVKTVMDSIDQLEAKYNPVKTAVITWDKVTPANYKADDVLCSVEYTREKAGPLSPEKAKAILECRSYDQQMYLPLRSICESLGEQVGWDNKTKQAYLVRGEQKIPVTGVLSDDTTFLKVRDFEKLGYKIDYDGSIKGMHKSTLTK